MHSSLLFPLITILVPRKAIRGIRCMRIKTDGINDLLSRGTCKHFLFHPLFSPIQLNNKHHKLHIILNRLRTIFRASVRIDVRKFSVSGLT